MTVEPDATFRWSLPPLYHFHESTRLLRTGSNDPTVRREPAGLWRAARLPSGAVTAHIKAFPDHVEADVWGPGAANAERAIPSWLGLCDSRWALPDHPVTNRLLRDHPGLRLANTRDVFEALLVTVLQQRVTWNEAAFAWRRLVLTFGEPAPGPGGLGLPPTPREVRNAGVDALMRVGMARQQARTLNEVAFSATKLSEAADLSTSEAMKLLQKVRGVGPWTAASAMGMRLGRPEPIILGDLHLPNTVCWALAREPRGTDERMTELLEPFAGHAFRVVRLIMAARIVAPRRGPRRALGFGWR